MPLVDQFGREIGLKPRPVRRRRPKNKPAPKRVPTTQVARVLSTQPIQVTLRAKHCINGQVYGPGVVTVPRKVADGLREQEGRAAQHDALFASTRACIIGPGRVKGTLGVREVAPEFFDLPELNMVPFGVVDRASATFHAN